MKNREKAVGGVHGQRDALTGLPGRRVFLDVLERCGACEGVGILSADLGGLGRINHAEGYLCGDACIRRAAEVLSDVLSGRGELFRAEGGTFALLGRAEPPELETLAAAVEAAVPLREGQPSWSLTAGWAYFAPADDRDLGDTWGRSLDAMRARKRADGR